MALHVDLLDERAGWQVLAGAARKQRHGRGWICEMLRSGRVDAWQRGGQQPFHDAVGVVIDDLGDRHATERHTQRSRSAASEG